MSDLVEDVAMVQDEKPISLWSMLREDIACVFERDPAARTKIEVFLTYPGVHAILLHRIAHKLWAKNWRFTGRFVSYISRLVTNIDIHPGATIGRRFFIDHGAGVVIGETAEVADDVTLYHGVTLGGTSWSQGKRHPTILSGVVIGAGAKVLGPVTVAENARVGANSVVISPVKPGTTVVGIPARTVKQGKDNLNPYGVDLNHHLIPDPVAEAFTCLIDRIALLEQTLEKVSGQPLDEPGTCPTCSLPECVREDDDLGLLHGSKKSHSPLSTTLNG